jgi:ankyrin repeat protein
MPHGDKVPVIAFGGSYGGMLAAWFRMKYPNVVQWLLSSDADINLCDEQGQSPLVVASEEGHCNVVKCLRSVGAVFFWHVF